MNDCTTIGIICVRVFLSLKKELSICMIRDGLFSLNEMLRN